MIIMAGVLGIELAPPGGYVAKLRFVAYSGHVSSLHIESNTGLVGGGRLPRPEEVTLSHRDVHLLHASGGFDQYRRLTNELPSQSGDALPDWVFHRSRKQRQHRRDLASSRFHDYPLERNQGVLFPRTALFYINLPKLSALECFHSTPVRKIF